MTRLRFFFDLARSPVSPAASPNLKKNLKRVIEEFPTSDEAKLAKNKLAEIR